MLIGIVFISKVREATLIHCRWFQHVRPNKWRCSGGGWGTRVINRFKQRLKLMKYDHNRLKMKLSMPENLHVLQYNNNNNNNNNNNYDNNKTSSQL